MIDHLRTINTIVLLRRIETIYEYNNNSVNTRLEQLINLIYV